jgi:hypothetical protein
MKRGPARGFIPGRLGNDWGIGGVNDKDEERPKEAYNASNKRGKKEEGEEYVLGHRTRARNEGWRSEDSGDWGV